jgi:uncharacterized protein
MLFMSQPPNDGSHNRHGEDPSPLSTLRTNWEWKGKYDAYGHRQDVDTTGCPLSMPNVYRRLNLTPEEVAEFCQKWQIVELALFGSILRDDFRINGDDPSDIDLLYVLAKSSKHSLFDIINMREELEILCKRKVDLVSKNAIQQSRNWLRRQDILSSGMVLYAQR